MNRCAQAVAPLFDFSATPDRPSVWMEENLVLPALMSPRSPGPLSFRTVPWAREILDQWHPESGTRKCSVAIAVQMIKTTMMTLGMCYRMKYGPVPQMAVGGMSADWAKREISKKRLHPLIKANPLLRQLMPHDPHQFGLTEMMMAYGAVLVTGAGSDTGLSGSTQGIVGIDEASKIKHQESEGAQEAHPYRLAQDRTKDYVGQEFIWNSSTPNDPRHPFWEDVEDGTFEHFYVPCPHCGEYFKFEFESFNGDKKLTAGELERTIENARPDIYRSIVWSPDARLADGLWSKQKIRETARYICPKNGCEIKDSDKPGMLEKYESKVENPTADPAHKSYRVPCFYKPSRTFGGFAIQFVDRGDLLNTGLQVIYNHELALPWEDIDVSVKDQEIWDCRATGDLAYQRGFVPRVKGMLFAGADWGQSMTHWVNGLIDADENIWIVDWGTVEGLQSLLRLRKEWEYERADKPGVKIRPRFGFIDSGDNANEIYKMCQQSGRFWLPTKGSGADSGEWHVSPLKNYPGLPLHTYVDKVAKDDLYDLRIHQKLDRRLYLPTNVTADYIAGLSGQRRLDRGRTAYWKKVKHDHYGDATKEIGVISWTTSGRRRPGNSD